MKIPLRKNKIPDEADGKDLGHILDYYPLRNYKLKRWFILITGVLAILTAIGLIINLYSNLMTAIQTHGRAMVLGVFPIPIAIYISFLIMGIIFVFLAKVHWWDSITLFNDGLIKDQGNRVQVWYYENIIRFDNYVTQITFGGSILGGQAKVILENKANKRLVIRDNFIRMPDLIQTLRARVLPGLFQRAVLQLKDGQILHFHKNLSASAVGVEIKQQMYPYPSIQADLKNRTFNLYHNENPEKTLTKINVTKIRNLDLFLYLLENPPNQTYQSSK